MDGLKLPSIQSLAAQLLRGPTRLRLRQLLQIEFLLSIIEADKDYPYDFVYHALTGVRPVESGGDHTRLLDGTRLIADLVLLAELLSGDADFEPDTSLGAAFTVNELAQRFDVSTKTIFRWRRRGLPGWRFRGEDRRQRVLFPERCVRRFVAQNADLVTRGSHFSQLTKVERQSIIERATALAGDGHRTVNAVARVISTETGRAVETVRLILKHHDEAHPGCGIFNRSALSLAGNDQRLAIWEAYQDHPSLESLAARFNKTPQAIYTTIVEMRARDWRARPIEFVDSTEFHEPNAAEQILASPTCTVYQPLATKDRGVPAGLPPYLAQLFRLPLLTKEGEVYLFRKLNFLRYQAEQARAALDPEAATASDLDEIEALVEAANRVKNDIVQANLRLVVGIAKRHVNATGDLFELISDGNVSLMRAVDKFDYSRGFKFSTYASWAIMKNFARSVPERLHHYERYQTGRDDMLTTTAATSGDEGDSDAIVAARRAVDRLLGTLDERERHILRHRYGLEAGIGGPQTLEQIGQRFGVSKERIRQLEARALAKLRGGFSQDVAVALGA